VCVRAISVNRKTIAFVALTLAISWTPVILAWFHGRRDAMDAGFAVLIFDVGPALAALLCALAFEKGQRPDALGVLFRLNLWWLWAPLIALGLTSASVAFIAMFSPYHLPGLHLMGYLLTRALGLSVFAVGEELGWRGYLYYLWRPCGFWRSSFLIGLIWGVWHWPLNYLLGANFPDHRALMLVLFPVYTMMLAPIMTLVRDGGRSIWPPAILHGAQNALVPLILATSVGPQFPWDMEAVSVPAVIGALLIALVQRGAPKTGSAQTDHLRP
jgi:membrane protease YdiL (CAAX protease family)